MVNLISKLHELERSDYSNVAVEKGIKYGADERQRLDVGRFYSPTLDHFRSGLNLQRNGKQSSSRAF